MSKTMMLAKGYDPKKVNFPVLVSEKLDGVPVVIGISKEGITVKSRTGKEVFSINHIVAEFSAFQMAVATGVTLNIVGELYNKDLPFKDISGQVRKQDGTRADVKFMVFDYYGTDELGFILQDDATDEFIKRVKFLELLTFGLDNVELIKQTYLFDQTVLDVFILEFFADNPKSEGIVIRDSKSPYEFKRSWSFQKLKAVETHDLIVESFEEAIDNKTGEGLGMVGRINCQYETPRGEVITIGVGPGKLTHAERKLVFGEQHTYIGVHAEVKAMPDPSYEALREPRFIRWRFDKEA